LMGRADGAARIGATLFSELLNAVFANVGQRAVRTVARQTFEQLLNLDLNFHLSRQTGGLTRAIDRGTKSVPPFAFGFVLEGPNVLSRPRQ
jgi:ATP-binding cassette subfamily B (MDR/TAP) protein 7